MPPDPLNLLRRHFGYPGFRPGQEPLVRAVLEGRDALGVLPTGGGKSVCYQVPALALEGLTLVVTPLVSLMVDQVARAGRVGLRAAHLSASQTGSERRAVAARARGGGLDVLFVSPERLESRGFDQLLAAASVAVVAVDEAHCISEWGNDFRPSYRRIGALRARLSCPLLALTATATPAVRADIVSSLRLSDPLCVVRSFDRPNLAWAVERVRPGQDRGARVRAHVRGSGGSAIVYAPTRRAVERLRRILAAWGVRVEAYHAGLEGAERARVQDAFMDGPCRVVVATNAFGMGIDKSDVRVVVHAHLPLTLEAYYQEAGRAGRDGLDARCVALFSPRDRLLGRSFVDRTHPRARRLRSAHRALLRVADEGGVADVGDPRLRRLLGPAVDAWAAGEGAGYLGALERVGAIRRIDGATGARGTGAGPEGSESRRIGVLGRVDVAAALRLRRRALDKLRAVERYAGARSCRRAALLHYFGEIAPARCGRCDRCGPDRTSQHRLHA